MVESRAALFLLLIIVQIQQPNFGLYSISGGEALGADIWSLFIYIFGIYSIFKLVKKIRQQRSANRIGD